MWHNLCTLSKIYPFKRPSLTSLIYQNPQIWYDTYLMSEEPHLAEIPGDYLDTEVSEEVPEIQAATTEIQSSGAMKKAKEIY